MAVNHVLEEKPNQKVVQHKPAPVNILKSQNKLIQQTFKLSTHRLTFSISIIQIYTFEIADTCKNVHKSDEECKSWTSAGYCAGGNYENWMKKNCNKECGFCGRVNSMYFLHNFHRIAKFKPI